MEEARDAMRDLGLFCIGFVVLPYPANRIRRFLKQEACQREEWLLSIEGYEGCGMTLDGEFFITARQMLMWLDAISQPMQRLLSRLLIRSAFSQQTHSSA